LAGGVAVLGAELQGIGGLCDVPKDVPQQVVATLAGLHIHRTLENCLEQIHQRRGVLLAGLACEFTWWWPATSSYQQMTWT
jgi:hypothetical protein